MWRNYNPGDDDRPFVTITEQTGCFDLAHPDDETTQIKVVIDEYDFENTFKCPPNWSMRNLEWDEALDELHGDLDATTISDMKSQDELAEILAAHRDDIHEAWREWRLDQIDGEIEDLREEREELAV